MTIRCPCCHQPIVAAHAPIEALEAAPLERKMRAIVTELSRIYPRGTTMSHLVDVVYGDDPDGGPDDAPRVVSVYLCRLRKKLPLYGWTIPKGQAGPGSQSRYRLEPVT